MKPRSAAAHPHGRELIADLDGFKGCNDAHGHAAGDEVLRAFGAALRSSSPLTALDGADLAMLATKRSRRRRQGRAAAGRD